LKIIPKLAHNTMTIAVDFCSAVIFGGYFSILEIQ
jgi:hypothetical protein